MSGGALVLMAVSLAMDAFAAAMSKGLAMRRMRWGVAAVMALYFGVFQALMPLVGWLVGTAFSRYIQAFDHWIAFFLLAFLGCSMMWESRQKIRDNAPPEEKKPRQRELLLLALATSIDALAAGVAFACLDMPIFVPVGTIGVVTCFISFGGVWIGFRFGRRFQRTAGLLGGVVLVLIGLKILTEHLFFGQ